MRTETMQFVGTRVVGAIMAVGLSLAGCGDTDPTDHLIAVEDNDLMIAHVAIDRGSLNGEPLLTIHGLDEEGLEVATASVRTGTVFYSADPDMAPGTASHGHELTITLGDQRFTSVSPSLEVLEMSEAVVAPVKGFIQLRPVAEALRDSFHFQALAAVANEVAFAPTTCPTNWFPITTPTGASGSSDQCCRGDSSYLFNTWHKIKNGSNINDIGVRQYFAACRDSGGATGCTSNCFYGPCIGGSLGRWEGLSNSVVFNPVVPVQPGCGYDTNGTTSGVNTGGAVYPVDYVAQTVWTGVTASCPSTQCLSNGSAANRLTGSIAARTGGKFGAWGSLTSNVGGLSIDNLSGAATGTADIATDASVTITACPDSFQGTARISGACTTITGAPGNCVQCNTTMSADKAATGVFTCSVEFGC